VRPLVLQHLLGERAQLAGQAAALDRLGVERGLRELDHQQEVEHAHVALGRLRDRRDRRHSRHDEPGGACAALEQHRASDARSASRHLPGRMAGGSGSGPIPTASLRPEWARRRS
jgi:hypothetical protein